MAVFSAAIALNEFGRPDNDENRNFETKVSNYVVNNFTAATDLASHSSAAMGYNVIALLTPSRLTTHATDRLNPSDHHQLHVAGETASVAAGFGK